MEKCKYLIPEESIDVMSTHVAALRQLETNLRQVFIDHRYVEVLVPSFEYVDLYQTLESGIDEEKMFQYMNHEGKRVALRTDFTLPLARLYSTQAEKAIKRYCYFGQVYRKEKRHKGRSSEFFQAGIELIGLGGIQGDLECLKIIQESLPVLGIKDIKIEISSAKFYRRLCLLVDDPTFVDILEKRDLSAMHALIERRHMQSPLKDLLKQLPRCFGDISLLDQTIVAIDDQELLDALYELKAIYEQLEHKENISFDLAMTPSMNYYTGIIIKGYSPKSAKTIINGGRYDKLMHHFDKDVPAIGFGYHLSHILKAIEKEEETHA